MWAVGVPLAEIAKGHENAVLSLVHGAAKRLFWTEKHILKVDFSCKSVKK